LCLGLGAMAGGRAEDKHCGRNSLQRVCPSQIESPARSSSVDLSVSGFGSLCDRQFCYGQYPELAYHSHSAHRRLPRWGVLDLVAREEEHIEPCYGQNCAHSRQR
jgi:hypothetical protein